ncbi:MAG: hypothetical protein LBM77_13170 [Spirochaetaceae bacterium]|jgi:2-oxoisovalerate dehydrogenase E1 component|nr:hypothetical protein [Spirochaetaceae bacterium]
MEESIRNGILERAVLIRSVEERLLELFSQGKLYGTVHTCIGEELSGSVLAEFLTAEDSVFSNHRCHGHCIALTGQVEGLIAEVMGRETGLCGGWGGSQHLHYKRFFSNGIQGGFVPITAGLALSGKLRKEKTAQGERAIAACFIGEGTLGEGAVYEAANLMSKWELPCLIILENNRYSQSTPQDAALAGNLLDRFTALDIQTFDTNTWKIDELYDASKRAVAYCRAECRPALLRIETDRLMAHSKGDDDRPKELVEKMWERDILSQFKKDEPGLYEQFFENARKRIDAAVAAAEKAPYPKKPQTVHTVNAVTLPVIWNEADLTENEDRRFNEIIRDCFAENMAQDERIVMIGEDICDPYGGAFKVTKGLSSRFPERVFGTSISESAIVGIGNGLSLGGMLPVCEIMFGDFMTLVFDQILNHAAKFSGMYHRSPYNAAMENPIIIRTPMGGGRGYGPTHSQSLEKFFLGIPQTIVLALNQRIDPALIYNRLFAEIKRPVMVFENKLLYSRRLSSKMEDGFKLEFSAETYPSLRIRPETNADITILCYGGSLSYTETAQLQVFDELDIAAEIICPLCIYPLGAQTMQAILDSVRKTKRLLIVEEGYRFAAWSSEIIARINELDTSALHSVRRVSMDEYPIPCSGPLELEMLPNADMILDTLDNMLKEETE